MTTTAQPHSTGHPPPDEQPRIGHPPLGEPHPWGHPPNVDHPGHQCSARLDWAAVGRWLIYAAVLALAATTVVAVLAIAANQPRTGQEPVPLTLGHNATLSEPNAPSQVCKLIQCSQTTASTSGYHGPTDCLPAASRRPNQGRGQ